MGVATYANEIESQSDQPVLRCLEGHVAISASPSSAFRSDEPSAPATAPSDPSAVVALCCSWSGRGASVRTVSSAIAAISGDDELGG